MCLWAEQQKQLIGSKRSTYSFFRLEQCDQIGRFIGLWAFLKPLATINLRKSPTLLGNFQVKSFLGNFYRHLVTLVLRCLLFKTPNQRFTKDLLNKVSLSNHFLNGPHFWQIFSLVCDFIQPTLNTYSKYNKCWRLPSFEPEFSGVWSDYSANCATTKSLALEFILEGILKLAFEDNRLQQI